MGTNQIKVHIVKWINFGDNILWQDKLNRYKETEQELYLYKNHVEQASIARSARQKIKCEVHATHYTRFS